MARMQLVVTATSALVSSGIAPARAEVKLFHKALFALSVDIAPVASVVFFPLS